MGREFFGRSRFAIYNFQMPNPRENYQIVVLRRFPSRRTHHIFPMKLGMLLLHTYTYIHILFGIIDSLPNVMHLSVSSPREGGGGVGHRVGILTFSKKNYQNPHPRAKKNCQK